jgi:tetratricopeptide (TPR) repeat protein
VKFAREAKENAAIQDALSTVVFAKMNAEEGEGEELADRFEVEMYPTFILLDAEGNILSRWAEYDGPEEFKRLVAINVSNPVSVEEKLALFQSDPSAEMAEMLGHICFSREEALQAVEYFRKAAELNQDDNFEVEIFDAHVNGFFNEQFKTEDVVAAGNDVLAAPDVAAEDLVLISMNMTTVADQAGDGEIPVPFIKKAMEAVANAEEGEVEERRIKRLELNHAIYVEKDMDKAVEIRRGQMPEGWESDPEALNRFAVWLFEYDVNLEEADELARKAVTLAEPGEMKANILDTVALFAAVRGEYDEAIRLEKQALAEDPENKSFAENLKTFQEKAASE